MDLSEEKFFESLARGEKKKLAGQDGSGEETEELEEEPIAELAKAAPISISRERLISKKQDRKEEVAEESEGEIVGQLTIDVYQTPDDIMVESAIAGIRPEDIDVDVTGDSVTIRGERKREKEIEQKDYFYQECYWGKFSRSVILPQEIDPESASVSFKNGILMVRLPKLNRSKSKKLKVKFE